MESKATLRHQWELTNKNTTLEFVTSQINSLNKKIVLTIGVFDVLHPGHLIFLENCKDTDSILIVGLLSDTAVRELKDNTRPLCNFNHRAFLLLNTNIVNYVFKIERLIQPNDITIDFIDLLKPNVICLVKDSPLIKIINNYIDKDEVIIRELPYSGIESTTNILENYKRKANIQT